MNTTWAEVKALRAEANRKEHRYSNQGAISIYQILVQQGTAMHKEEMERTHHDQQLSAIREGGDAAAKVDEINKIYVFSSFDSFIFIIGIAVIGLAVVFLVSWMGI